MFVQIFFLFSPLWYTRMCLTHSTPSSIFFGASYRYDIICRYNSSTVWFFIYDDNNVDAMKWGSNEQWNVLNSHPSIQPTRLAGIALFSNMLPVLMSYYLFSLPYLTLSLYTKHITIKNFTAKSLFFVPLNCVCAVFDVC